MLLFHPIGHWTTDFPQHLKNKTVASDKPLLATVCSVVSPLGIEPKTYGLKDIFIVFQVPIFSGV